MWAALGKAAMGGLKAGAKKVATDKLLNRKKKRSKMASRFIFRRFGSTSRVVSFIIVRVMWNKE